MGSEHFGVTRQMHRHLPAATAVQRFNKSVAIRITQIVGSMWCAYAFALFDLISLPDAISAGTAAIVSWIAQTFLQLVLLSVIMVGQNVQAEAGSAREQKQFEDTERILAILLERESGNRSQGS